jgi:sec-independent protein translocase protein TatA
MDFFGMGMGEILLILLVALIIWGPGRITEVGRTMGKVARTLKKATFDLTTQITKETEEQEKKLPTPEKKDEASGGQGTRVSEQ